jgi:hypothetical protein
MKKYYLIISAMALMMAACTESAEFENDSKNSGDYSNLKVDFGSYVGKGATRAGATGVLTTDELKTTGFGVMASYTNTTAWASATGEAKQSNFMYNEGITWNNSTWTYATTKYWPNDPNQKISFFAYAPYVETVNGESGITAIDDASAEEPKISYKLDPINFVDLLWASAIDQNRMVNNNCVSFNFKHIVSKFMGDVKAKISKEELAGLVDPIVTIEQITVENIDENIATSGKLDLHTGVFVNDAETTPAAFKMSLESPFFTDAAREDAKANIDLKAKPTALDGKGLATTATSILDPKVPSLGLYFLPGTQPHFKVTVKYWVRTKDANLPKGVTNVAQTVTSVIQYPTPFEQNKKYNLVLNIGLNSVQFQAEVAAFGATEETVEKIVDLPAVNGALN